MLITNNEGEQVDCALEIIKERIDGMVLCSDIREPTEAEVVYIKGLPCDHGVQTMQLVHDEPGFPYDFRDCALCGAGLGTV